MTNKGKELENQAIIITADAESDIEIINQTKNLPYELVKDFKLSLKENINQVSELIKDLYSKQLLEGKHAQKFTPIRDNLNKLRTKLKMALVRVCSVGPTEEDINREQCAVSTQSTESGYILSDTAKAASKGTKIKSTSTNYIANDSIVKLNTLDQEIINHNLQTLWEIDSVPSIDESLNTPSKLSFSEGHFLNNVKMLPSKHIEVSLPFIKDSNLLGDSFNRALTIFYSQEKRLIKESLFFLLYKEYFKDLIQSKFDEYSGPLSSYNPNLNNNQFFLPHHGIFKRDSQKLRVVIIKELVDHLYWKTGKVEHFTQNNVAFKLLIYLYIIKN